MKLPHCVWGERVVGRQEGLMHFSRSGGLHDYCLELAAYNSPGVECKACACCAASAAREQICPLSGPGLVAVKLHMQVIRL